MPLYEYECPQCGLFERMQKFSDPILTTCPTCEKPVEKLLSEEYTVDVPLVGSVDVGSRITRLDQLGDKSTSQLIANGRLSGIIREAWTTVPMR